MSTGSLRVERTGPAGVVARVSLARPEVHNAFDAGLIAELRTTFALQLRLRTEPEKAGRVSRALAGAGVTLTELRPLERTLEEVFLEMTGTERTGR